NNNKKSNKLNKMIAEASEKDLEEANKKYEIVTKYLNGENVDLNVTRRSLRNWVKKYNDAEELYGNGYVGLLHKTKKKENKNSKVPQKTEEIMNEVINQSYKNIKSKTAKQVYRELLVKCEELNIDPPSYQTLCTAINNLSIYEVEESIKGRRAAYKFEEFYTELEFTTPKHGERIFELAHI